MFSRIALSLLKDFREGLAERCPGVGQGVFASSVALVRRERVTCAFCLND